MRKFNETDQTGWEWHKPIEETSYFRWLDNGHYQDRWLDEVKEFQHWLGDLTPRQISLTRLVHSQYHYLKSKGH